MINLPELPKNDKKRHDVHIANTSVRLH